MDIEVHLKESLTSQNGRMCKCISRKHRCQATCKALSRAMLLAPGNGPRGQVVCCAPDHPSPRKKPNHLRWVTPPTAILLYKFCQMFPSKFRKNRGARTARTASNKELFTKDAPAPTNSSDAFDVGDSPNYPEI